MSEPTVSNTSRSVVNRARVLPLPASKLFTPAGILFLKQASNGSASTLYCFIAC